ncbi:Putative purine permease ygfU [Raoultella terrigena]|uniref:Purine permease ygfU n=1 Tax=Raoultella terrigena TaxID=577 RepID=A0A3P8KK25_RAOTE|nr:Putative purine permease ygfU [Raoultella terrigena]
MIGDRLGLSKETVALLISSDLFCCGVVTLLQCIGVGRFMGIRLPVIMSVTFAAVTPMLAIGMNPDIGLMGIFGATIAAGIITTLLAPLIGRLMPLFSPAGHRRRHHVHRSEHYAGGDRLGGRRER